MVNQNIASTIASLANRVLMVILLMILVPLFFWIINFTVHAIIHIIMPQFINGKTLANMVGVLGFTDDQVHQDWSYDQGYPDWNHYNLFLGTFGSFFCMIIFFYLGLSLIQRIFDLFLLYITSPIIFATAVSNAQWQKVNLWKDLVIGRFISTLGIVLTLTLFMNLEPLMLKVADQVSDNWVGQVSFKLLFITGGATATLSTQLLFSSLVGQTVGIMDGMRMLTTMKAVSSTLKAGTLGVLGGGKRLLIGKRKITKNDDGEKNRIVDRLQSGGIARVARFATKATVGSVLTAAGFIDGSTTTISSLGVKGSLKRAGNHAIVNPSKKLANVIKNKSSQQYQKGTQKHQIHNLKKDLKNQLKTDIKQPSTLGAVDKPIVGDIGNSKGVIYGTTARYTNKPNNKIDKEIIDKYFENGQPNWYDDQSHNQTTTSTKEWYDTKKPKKGEK